MRDLRLVAEPVAPALRVRRVRRPVEVEVVDPAVRPVVDREPEDRHVVGVHDAVDEADAHPVRDHARGPLADLGEPVGAQLLAIGRRELGKVAPDREVDQLLEQRSVATRRRKLEIAEADERRRDAAHDRAGLELRMAVVEHVALDLLAGRDEAQRARRRHAEVVHRLAAQELADRRSQHRASVGAARVRRLARALELQLPALAGGVDDLAEVDRAPVAELPGPVAELVAAVVRGVRLHALDERVAAEDLREPRRRDIGFADAEPLRHLARMGDQMRCRDRRRDRRASAARRAPAGDAGRRPDRPAARGRTRCRSAGLRGTAGSRRGLHDRDGS